MAGALACRPTRYLIPVPASACAGCLARFPQCIQGLTLPDSQIYARCWFTRYSQFGWRKAGMLYKIVTGIALASVLAFGMIAIAETREEGITRARLFGSGGWRDLMTSMVLR